MTTAEAIGAALAAALAPHLENLTQRSTNRSMVDTRGIGRPPSFDGSDKSWREWVVLDDGLLVCHRRHRRRFTEVGGPTRQCHHHRGFACQFYEHGEVDEAGVERARAFSRKLYLILSDTCKGEPYRMVESAGFGQGFEAWSYPASQGIQDARYQASAASGCVHVETRQLS